MKAPLHILHLEGNATDAALVESSLVDDGIACVITRVENGVDFVTALEGGAFDLVLTDHTLPNLDGLSAMAVVRNGWPGVPVILVAGMMSEESAIEVLKSGATDYALKRCLARLAPAVRRAMREVSERAERKRLETRYLESQKMEVIGQLATGVAHDFNNILGVIMGYSDIMLMQISPGDSLRHHVAEIRRASERAAGLTRQLLVFGRQQIVQPTVLELNGVLFELEQMLQRLIDENIEMKIVPETQQSRILADPGYVGQVVMNLVVNARDAMPNGGRLTLATRKVTLDECHARAHAGALPGDYVMLAVSDTGTGMTEDVKAHLFEAFFTTKPAGKGTGLGLATCQTIVRQSGGHIGVDSEPGRGTTFKVYFPCRNEPLPEHEEPVVPTTMPRGSEVLLFVEDEPAVRHLARDVLSGQGYDVLTAVNGQDGLRAAREHQGAPVKLVVTDVIMPLMGGKVMAEWLKAMDPNLKILFTSGYTDDTIAHHGVLDAGVEFLAKPYTPASLTRKVRELLDA